MGKKTNEKIKLDIGGNDVRFLGNAISANSFSSSLSSPRRRKPKFRHEIFLAIRISGQLNLHNRSHAPNYLGVETARTIKYTSKQKTEKKSIWQIESHPILLFSLVRFALPPTECIYLFSRANAPIRHTHAIAAPTDTQTHTHTTHTVYGYSDANAYSMARTTANYPTLI